MCAVPLVGLQKDDLSLEQLQTLQKLIKKRIPTGGQPYSATATVHVWFAASAHATPACASP